VGRTLLVVSVVLGCLTSPRLASAQFGWLFGPRGPAYALDDVSRRPSGPSQCHPEAMVRYRATSIRTSGGVRVHPAFAARLPELERVVREVAIAHYGRAPRRMLTVGGYACRSIRGRRDRLSEHALGNALDVRGFELGPLPRRAEAPAGLPRSLRRPFTVTLSRDWTRTDEIGARHAAFLRALVERLVQEDVFRVIYGPRHRGHGGHFHFDMSPFRWIDV
jgi:hypothetical protein